MEHPSTEMMVTRRMPTSELEAAEEAAICCNGKGEILDDDSDDDDDGSFQPWKLHGSSGIKGRC